MYKIATNPRFIRIPYKNIVLLEQGKQVTSTAIHRKFSPTRVLWLLFKVCIHLLFNHLATSKVLGLISMSDFIPAKAVLLRRLLMPIIYGATGSIPPREIVVRIWFTVNAVWTPILLLDSIHTMLAMFFIYVVRTDIPAEWPDLFGSLFEAFTLGRFWTRYVPGLLCLGDS